MKQVNALGIVQKIREYKKKLEKENENLSKSNLLITTARGLIKQNNERIIACDEILKIIGEVE